MTGRRYCGGSHSAPLRLTAVPGYGICSKCLRPFSVNKSGQIRGHSRISDSWDVQSANWRSPS